MRQITPSEVLGFRKLLLEKAVTSDFADYELLDVCGTGGDGKDTFNISTLTAILSAACGQVVAKHGNYASSSICGSSNVLENLGIKFTNDFDVLRKCLDEAGICFLHAPLFHPALKTVGPIRKELGVRTFFNILGPLVNPLMPKYQCSGVSSFQIQRLYAQVLESCGNSFAVIYDMQGYDEVSLTGSFRFVSSHKEHYLEPSDFELSVLDPEELSAGSSISDASQIFLDVLQNKASVAKQNVVAANTALALMVCNPELSLLDAFQKAKENLLNGNALKVYQKLKSVLEAL